jgi:hypothetical protein
MRPGASRDPRTVEKIVGKMGVHGWQLHTANCLDSNQIGSGFLKARSPLQNCVGAFRPGTSNLPCTSTERLDWLKGGLITAKS